MPTARERYEVISVSLPQDLVRRANAVIHKTRRSRVIADVLAAFLGNAPSLDHLTRLDEGSFWKLP